MILQNGWEDKDFCSRFVNNLDALRESVRDYTVEYVASRAKVPPTQLYAAANMFAHARKATAVSGTGVCMAAHANLADHMIESLNAICGAYRRAGEPAPSSGTLFPRSFTERAASPCRTWETGVKSRISGIGQLMGEFQSALLPDEILVPGPDKIRALVVFAGNPAVALAQPDKTIAAFKELELLVTIDPRMTQTALLSHYVIAPTLPFERHDLSLVADAFINKPFVQYSPPLIVPPAETLSEVEFFWRLARRMGLQLVFKPLALGASYSATPGGHVLDMNAPPDQEQLIRWVCQVNNVPFDDLKASPGGILFDHSIKHVAIAADSGGRLDVCPADIASELQEVKAEKPSNQAFRYRLIVRRHLETMNSAYRSADATRRRYPTNPAFMHPDDMAVAELTSGDSIEIESENGRIVGVVRADPTLRQSVIAMSHGWGILDVSADTAGHYGGHTARLVSIEKDLDRITYMPRHTAIPVNIRRIDQSSQAVS